MTRTRAERDDHPKPASDPRTFQWIRADQLVIDQRIQREVSSDKVSRIVNEFDWSRFEAITVVPIGDDKFLVVEGQHRTLAAQSIDSSWMLACMVLSVGVDQQQQAQIALDIVQGRATHSAYEQWRQRLNAGHPHERMAEQVMSKHGVRLGRKPSTMTIGAAATMRRIVHGGGFDPEEGAELLDRTLGLLIAAFPTYDQESNIGRWDANLLLAAANLMMNNPEAEVDEVAVAMRVKPAVQWVSIGKQFDSGPPWHRIYDAVVAQYNKGRRRGRMA